MAIAYVGVMWIEAAVDAAGRKRRLLLTIFLLFLPLAFLQYGFHLSGRYWAIFGVQGKRSDLPLPLGVSFVTFTLTAYIVDIYQGKFADKVSLSTLTGYVLFFPHLIAGPIC